MKKKILLVFFVLLLTGCVRTDLNKENYDELVLNVINNKKHDTNEVGSGYQFYVPKGVRLLENDNNNQVFIGLGTKIYMYVDITSYHYKNALNYETTEDSFYIKRLNSGSKTGFIQIIKEDSQYFVKIIYNYAKVEVYTDEYNLNNVITLSSIILNSIEYNDTIIEKLLDDNHNSGSEITYNIDKPADASNDFSSYLEEYITEEEASTDSDELPDK